MPASAAEGMPADEESEGEGTVASAGGGGIVAIVVEGGSRLYADTGRGMTEGETAPNARSGAVDGRPIAAVECEALSARMECRWPLGVCIAPLLTRLLSLVERNGTSGLRLGWAGSGHQRFKSELDGSFGSSSTRSALSAELTSVPAPTGLALSSSRFMIILTSRTIPPSGD